MDASGPPGRAGKAGTISPTAVFDRLVDRERINLLDLRNLDEFEDWHIDGPSVDAKQIPYVEFVQAEATGSVEAVAAGTGLDEPIVAVCGRGEASGYVAGLLSDAGIEAVNLEGGMDAWAELYVRRELPLADGARVFQYQRASSGCLGYLVAADGEAAVIDPLKTFADRYVVDAGELGCDLTAAIDTHVHADHVSGIRAIADATRADPVLPARSVARGVSFDVEPIEDGDRLEVGSTPLEVVALPGHTSGMTGFRVGDVLLTGDSLFVESVARPDLEKGDAGAADAARQLHRTLHERILPLQDETTIAPGHFGAASTAAPDRTFTARIGDLRDRLELLGIGEDEFASFILDDMPPRPANFERIIAINLGRQRVDDAEAFELELGPNNCAATAAAD